MARYQFDQYRFDSSDGSLERPDRSVRHTLRPQVALLLAQFLERPDKVLSREELCAAVWGDGRVVDFEAGLSALVKELRQILAEAGASPDLVETVPRRGYRFRAAQVLRLDHSREAGRRMWPVWMIAAALAAALLAAAMAWWLAGEPDTVPTTTTPSLAILPFERFGDPDRLPEHAELLLPDSLLARLWQVELEGLDLIGRTSIRPYADRADVAAAVAAELDVSLLIEGSLIAEPGAWRVEVRMLTVPGGRVLWSESLDWPEHEELPVRETAEELARRLDEQWSSIREQKISE